MLAHWHGEPAQYPYSGRAPYGNLADHRDLAHLVDCCLTVEGVQFDIVYGVSGNTWRFWDIAHAQQVLGYTPQDNAEAYRTTGGSL